MQNEEFEPLDPVICERARMARDPKYDGLFFSGIKTTKIYCRPVCPVRPAKSENVIFFKSAAAAEMAGFRPCLRCRPETAQGSGAWRGAATTVGKALRMIDEGFLDNFGIEELAERLGVGTRHLSRLFAKHVGASATQVAATKRVQRAKRLLDETSRPITEIAFEAGFRSVRRFNDAFKAAYKRSPSSIRRQHPIAKKLASQERPD